MDLGFIFGFLGFATAVLSAIYSRAQAAEARRQAEAAHLEAAVELNRAMNEQMLQSRMGLVNNPMLAREYLEANPAIGAVYGDVEGLAAHIQLRNLIDSFQDIYFLRKRGIAEDHHWRQWTSALLPVSRMASFRAVFDSCVQRAAIEEEFAAFMNVLFEGKPPVDPRPRALALK